MVRFISIANWISRRNLGRKLQNDETGLVCDCRGELTCLAVDATGPDLCDKERPHCYCERTNHSKRGHPHPGWQDCGRWSEHIDSLECEGHRREGPHRL